ncbi:hypothetical protein C1O66_12075 [Paucibacter aquatile]|uniref:Uncharacterized protein n=1 Tax=Kinneretia aquatilis TaxID=2070761 RepID=A0A2N8KXR0_9BURK|nr:hypothetical protein [Paucibacter aquatile]PND38182.1 hypothetical protein C1O66_12075 [Paucibacter aquatile]
MNALNAPYRKAAPSGTVLWSLLWVISMNTAHSAPRAPAPAAGRFLISETEWKQERATPPPPSTKFSPAPGAPRLELLQPKPGPDTLASPFDIQLRWNAEGEARIEPQTLRIRYGWMGLDITQRVLAQAEVTAEGLRIRKAALPSGEHKLAVEIADSLQRVGRRQFEVKVQAAP